MKARLSMENSKLSLTSVKISDNLSISRSQRATILVEKLVAAFELHDYSTLTLDDIHMAVELQILRPETAQRLARGCCHVG